MPIYTFINEQKEDTHFHENDDEKLISGPEQE